MPVKRKIRVAVIFGGRSGEHEVSLASARSIMAVMDRERYEVVPIGITHAGRWLVTGDPLAVLCKGGEEEPAGEPGDTAAAIGRELVPGATGQQFPAVDVVFPVLHGPFGEDGTIQGLLELAGLPYVGCGVLASALAMDKVISKQVFAAHGLPVVRNLPVKRQAWEADPEAVVAEIEGALSYPLFVKPANLGSSIGVSKARERAQLKEALAEAARYDRKILVEEAVPQAREIECSVLGNDDPIASVPGEVVPSDEFYSYAAKYLTGESKLLIPAPLPEEVAAQVRQLAVAAFRAIDGAGLARVDFLMDGTTGQLYVNEINTLPGFTQISMYPKLWEASGIPYPTLIDRLIELALERHADRARCLTTYSGALSPAQLAGPG
jgi:D-alanine-D-alanine ligase